MSRSSDAVLSGFRIKVHRDHMSPIEHALEDGRSVFIGSSDSCGIQIKGDGVAGIHCLIDVEDQKIFVQDWASDNGTKVNGQAIEDKTSLQSGDILVVGSVKLELLGQPAEKAPVSLDDADADEEPREESVGMETLGYDSDEIQPPAVVSEHTPRAQAPANRLSDALARPVAKTGSKDSPVPIDVDDQSHNDFSEDFDSGPDSFERPSFDEPSFDNTEYDEPELAASSFDQSDDEATASGFGSGFDDEGLSADDLDWDPESMDDEVIDPEIVQLLKNEIEDLRIQLAERDEQLAAMEGLRDVDGSLDTAGPISGGSEFAGEELVGRVDELLAELEEHDERVAMLQELLQTAEIQNQAQREERNCLESWVGEIEQRIGQRESEWQAEQDALRERLEATCEERDRYQQKLHAAAKRFGKSAAEGEADDEMLKQLQEHNAQLQASLEEAGKQCTSLKRQLERAKNTEPESMQAERAELAKEKATVSRMRFELSKQLQELGGADAPENENPDREFAYKLQTLREHLREIHEEEKIEREQRGESLFGRISGLWKRVEDRY